jgi:hypothetical protein
MDILLQRIGDYGALASVLAYLLYVGHAKILPLWKDTLICLNKAIETLDEHLEYMRMRNGK